MKVQFQLRQTLLLGLEAANLAWPLRAVKILSDEKALDLKYLSRPQFQIFNGKTAIAITRPRTNFPFFFFILSSIRRPITQPGKSNLCELGPCSPLVPPSNVGERCEKSRRRRTRWYPESLGIM